MLSLGLKLILFYLVKVDTALSSFLIKDIMFNLTPFRNFKFLSFSVVELIIIRTLNSECCLEKNQNLVIPNAILIGLTKYLDRIKT